MSFEAILKKDLLAEEFGVSRYRRNFKERPNISKGKMDMYDNVKYLKVGEFYSTVYTPTEQRFVSALGMSYDMLISVFDVNTMSLGVCRIYGFDLAAVKRIEDYVMKLAKKGANIEARLIGLQNKQDYRYIFDLVDFFIKNKIPLMEVDLFGNETRNLAVDAKLGLDLNVLMQDRLYKPGELANSMTVEQFEAGLKQH